MFIYLLIISGFFATSFWLVRLFQHLREVQS